jgi:Tfp pilus assembly protein PilE
LVEIIAVLVILAILTAVAVPRYFDLATTAKQRAMDAALATGVSVCNMSYAREAAKAGGVPTVANVSAAAAGTIVQGDFNLAYTVVGATIRIDASGKAGSPVSGVSTSKVWTMP